MNDKMPVFVQIDEYKDILDVLGVIKNKVSDAKEMLEHLSQLKQKEDEEIANWKLSIEDLDKKVQYIDHTLFEPENL